MSGEICKAASLAALHLRQHVLDIAPAHIHHDADSKDSVAHLHKQAGVGRKAL